MSRAIQAIYWQAGWIEGRKELIKMLEDELEALRSDTEFTCFPISDYHIGQMSNKARRNRFFTDFCFDSGCGGKGHTWKDCEYAERCEPDMLVEWRCLLNGI